MRFLRVLLPNFYDVFTVFMIAYAFMLNKNSKLVISFGLCCLLIYITTRVGILAGMLVQKMLGGQPVIEGNPEEIPPDVLMKKMLLDFAPQCILVIICHVILALCFLQNPAVSKSVKAPEKPESTQEQLNAQNEDQSKVVTEVVDNTGSSSVSTSFLDEDDEDEITPVTSKTVKKPVSQEVTNRIRRNIAPSASSAKSVSQKANQDSAQAQVANVYYEIPERTLNVAGISAAERRINYAPKQTAVSSTTTKNGDWSFSAVPANTSNVANTKVNNVTTKPVATSASQTKRYPGDDNPIDTNWGYYKSLKDQVKNRTVSGSGN